MRHGRGRSSASAAELLLPFGTFARLFPNNVRDDGVTIAVVPRRPEDLQLVIDKATEVVFERFDEPTGNAVVVAVNRGKTEASVSVDAPAAWRGAVSEVVEGTAATLDGGRLNLVVPPRQARVFVSE